IDGAKKTGASALAMTVNGSARNSGESGSNDSSTGQPDAGAVVIADLLGGLLLMSHAHDGCGRRRCHDMPAGLPWITASTPAPAPDEWRAAPETWAGG